MSICWCSLAGTAACRTCANNPYAETPPPVRTYIVSATDPVLITWQKTNADRIRQMTDEELARFIARQAGRYCDYKDPEEEEYERILPWLKSPVEVDNG